MEEKIPEGYKQTEVGVIPEDWEVKRLGTVAYFKNGKAHENYISEDGNYIVVNSKFISSEGSVAKYSTRNFSPANDGDITLVMSDIPNGKALAKCYLIRQNNRFAVNQRICSLSAYGVDNTFLFYVLNRNSYFLQFDNGVSQTNLRKDEVLSCLLPVPPTANEQTAIAKVLSDIDALIESLDKLIAKKKLIKKGAMQGLLTGKRRLPGFSGEWEVKKLGEIGRPYGGLSGKSKKDFESGKYPYIPFLNIMNNPVIDPEYFDFVNIHLGENQNRAQKGDLFFNGSSETPEEIGMCSVLLDNIPDLYLNSFCFGFRLNKEVNANGLYLSYFFRSNVGRKLIFFLAQGATRHNLSKNSFLTLEIPYPRPEEQTAIAQVLSDMDEEIEALEKKRDKYKMIKQGAMQLLLTGKVRLVKKAQETNEYSKTI